MGLRLRRILAGILLTTIHSLAHAADPIISPHTGFEISAACYTAYQEGLKAYADAIAQNQRGDFESILKLKPDQHKTCLFEFTVGAVDGQAQMAQTLLVEYQLERRYFTEKGHASDEALSFLKAQFEKRLEMAMINPAVLNYAFEHQAELNSAVAQLETKMFEKAAKDYKAVSFGRFVFAPHPSKKIRALYEYQLDPSGKPTQDRKGQLILTDGSYSKIVHEIQSQARSLAEEYLKWEPSVWFGEDSWIFGSIWRYYFNREAPGIREVKEESYFELYDLILKHARNYGMDMRPFYAIHQLMLQKQRAYIDRDLKTVRAMQLGMVAAPLVPLGMYLGAAGLAYAGLPAMKVGTFTVTVSSGAWYSSANVAAASSLLALTSMAAYRVYQNREFMLGSEDRRLVRIADTVIPAVVSSFPVAAAVPAIVGGSAPVAKYLFVEGKSFLKLMGSKNGIGAIRSMGARELAGRLASLPATTFKAWVNAWWKINPVTGLREFDKGMLALYLAGEGIGIVAEFIDRQILQTNPDDKFWVNGKINDKALYKIIPGMVTSLIASPILKFENFWSRFIAWRLLNFTSSTGITFLVKRDRVDWDYVSFNMFYESTLGTAIGDTLFGIEQKYIEKSALPLTAKVALRTLLKASLSLPRTRLKNLYLEAYLDGKPLPGSSELRQIFLSELKLKLEGISDQELQDAFVSYMKDPEFIAWAKAASRK